MAPKAKPKKAEEQRPLEMDATVRQLMDVVTTVQLRYQKAQLRDPKRFTWDDPSTGDPPFTQPVDDVLALLEPDAAWRARELWPLYGDAGNLPLIPVATSLSEVEALIKVWQADRVPEKFLAAAREATGGWISRLITPYLADRCVRFVPEHDGAEVADLLSLAAWSLLMVAQRGGYQVRGCARCGLPFLATGRGRFCRRAVRGSRAGLTCREVRTPKKED